MMMSSRKQTQQSFVSKRAMSSASGEREWLAKHSRHGFVVTASKFSSFSLNPILFDFVIHSKSRIHCAAK